MTDKNALRRLLDYTVWADHRVLRAAATLSLEDFRRDRGASHGGVRGTLVHVLFAEWLWVERFKGLAPAERFDEGEFPDVLALSERWRAVERHREAWLRSLRPAAASGKISYRTTKGETFTAPLWQLVQHVANHASFHRGQVVAMLRQLGVQPPATDLVLWDREAPARARRRGNGRS